MDRHVNRVHTVHIPAHGPARLTASLEPTLEASAFGPRGFETISSVWATSRCVGEGTHPRHWERQRGPGRRLPSTAKVVMEPRELGPQGPPLL